MDPVYSAYVPVALSPTEEVTVGQVAQNCDNWAVFFDATLAQGTFVARLYAITAAGAALVGQATLGAGVTGQKNIEIVRSPIRALFLADEPSAAGAATYELRLFSVDASGTVSARLAGFSYTANAADAQNGTTQAIPAGGFVTFGTLTGQFQFLDAYVNGITVSGVTTRWRILARGGAGGPTVLVDQIDLPPGNGKSIAIFTDITKVGGDQYFLEGSVLSGGSLSATAVLAGRTSALVQSATAQTGINIEDEGVPIAGNPYTTLNFVGGGVVATPAGIVIPGGGGAVVMMGDVTGTSATSVVEKVHGATVPISGGLTVGNVLQVIGAAALAYAAVNLAGGANFVTGVLPTANQAAQSLAGDVSGTTALNVVDRVHGATVPIAGALVTGNVLQVTGISALGYAPVNLAGGANFVTGVLPTANQAAQSLAGDVSGTTAANIVDRIHGATVPIAGALTTGNVLQVTGVSALGYAPVNLAGGGNFVTGLLPTANQAAQSLAGDATGTTAAVQVTRINGATVPAAGALTTGNVLQVTGVGALSYAPVNLAGGANFVTGALPSANQAAQTLSGDVTGTTAASIVQTLTGVANIVTVPTATHIDFGVNPAASGVLRFPNGGSSIIIARNSTNTGDIVGVTIDSTNTVILGSGGQTNTTKMSAKDGSNNVYEWETSATGVNGRRAGTTFFSLSTAGLMSLTSAGGQDIVLTPSSGNLQIGGPNPVSVLLGAFLVGQFNFTYGAGVTTPLWSQTAPTGATAGTTWTWRAQGGGTGAQNGGYHQFQGGARSSTGLRGGVRLQLNGTTETMFEIAEVITGNSISVLNRNSNITSTQAPANTGHLVTYLGDAGTLPTANMVTGCTLYSNTSVFSFRNGAANGGNRIEWTCISSAAATQGGAAIPALAQEFMDFVYNGNVRKVALFNA